MAAFSNLKSSIKPFVLATGIIFTLIGIDAATRRSGIGAEDEPVIEPAAGNYSIEVRKAERRLILRKDGKVVQESRIALGFSPIGTKLKEGDGATPEGTYRITRKNPKSAYYLSLGLDYPNREDARRGLAKGLIRQSQYDAIVAAIEAGKTPPQDTPLGGDIFIHGNGAAKDWTLGCVALEDHEMKVLFDSVPLRTVVKILP